MAPRNPGQMQHEAQRAVLSMAGFRLNKQASVTVGAGAAQGYTVTEVNTRRVAVIHLGGGTPAVGDIRYDYKDTAQATDIPIPHNQFFVVDAAKDDALSFYNTSGGSIVVYVAELD